MLLFTNKLTKVILRGRSNQPTLYDNLIYEKDRVARFSIPHLY